MFLWIRKEKRNITTEEYRVHFNTIPDAIQKLSYIQNSLIAAQQQAEELVSVRNSRMVAAALSFQFDTAAPFIAL